MATPLVAALLSGCAGAPPTITALNPINGRGDVPVDAPLRVQFDHAIDRGSVGSRLHVDPALNCDLAAAFAGRDSACHIVWSADSTTFTIVHADALMAPNTKYRFHLDAGVRDPQGVENGLDHGWELTSAVAPTVRSVVPGNGSTAVGVDTGIGVTFSVPMEPLISVDAIHLEPAVPGTRVIADARDPTGYRILPGRLLDAATLYRIRIDATATEAHGATLEAEVVSTFVTGGLSPQDHAVILARHDGEGPTQVVLSGLSGVPAGQPAASAIVLDASRCDGPTACGGVPPGAPTETFDAATATPSGSHVAVLVRDQTALHAGVRLDVLDLPSGARHVIDPSADLPSWSPDGRTLAYSSAGRVAFWSPVTGALSFLPPGDPLDSPPVWSRNGSVLALPVRAADGLLHVELADPVLRMRYPVPQLRGEARQPVLDATGSTLAVRRDGADAGTWLVQLRTGDPTPRLLAPDVEPVTLADGGILFAVQRPLDGSTGGLVRIDIAGGSVDPIPGGPAPGDLSTVRIDSRARTICFLLADASGSVQAWAENTDGSSPVPLTQFEAASLDAVAVDLP